MPTKLTLPMLLSMVLASPVLGQERWPTDQLGHQMPHAFTLEIPSCGELTPLLTLDSIGAVSPGQSLAALEEKCPELYYAWDWGDEGIPEPAIAVRLGEVVVRAVFEDTLPSSAIYRIELSDGAVRTEDGFGPGSLVADMIDAWGEPEFWVAECVLWMWFSNRPGLSWRVGLGRQWDCVELARREYTGDLAQLPPGARVIEAILYRPAP